MTGPIQECLDEIDQLNNYLELSPIYNLVVPALNGRTVERLDEGEAMYLMKELVSLPPTDNIQKMVKGSWVRFKVDDQIVKMIEVAYDNVDTVIVFEEGSGEALKKEIVEDLVHWISSQKGEEIDQHSFQVMAFKWINGKLHVDLQQGALYFQFEMDLQTHRANNKALFELKPAGAKYVALRKECLNHGEEFLFPALSEKFLNKMSSYVPGGELKEQHLAKLTFESLNIEFPQYTAGPMPYILGFRFYYDKEGKKVLLNCDAEGKYYTVENEE